MARCCAVAVDFEVLHVLDGSHARSGRLTVDNGVVLRVGSIRKHVGNAVHEDVAVRVAPTVHVEVARVVIRDVAAFASVTARKRPILAVLAVGERVEVEVAGVGC